MDEKQVLKEAKKTIDNINAAQDTLNAYLDRLEKIVKELEYEIYTEEHLTLKDVQMINTKLEHVVDQQELQEIKLDQNIKEKEDATKKRKKKHVNVFTILSIFVLMLTISLHYLRQKPMHKLFDYYYSIYELADMEQSIPMNSLLKIDSERQLSMHDFVVYEDRFSQIRVKQYLSVDDGSYVLINKNNNFGSEEIVDKDKIKGVVAKFYPIQGQIIHALSSSLWIMYALSLILFILSLVSKKDRD